MRRIRPQSASNNRDEKWIKRICALGNNIDPMKSESYNQKHQRDTQKLRRISNTTNFSTTKPRNMTPRQSTGMRQRSYTKLTNKGKDEEDNNPMYQYKTVKQIALIDAYDPARLKNVTVKKKGISDFFSKYNPDNNILGKMFIKSTINNFKEWKKKIIRKYYTVFQYFCKSQNLDDMEKIGQELKSISGQSYLMLNLIETLLRAHEGYEIRQLAQQFKQLLLRSLQFHSALSVHFECKRRLITIIKSFQNKQGHQQMITNLADRKRNQIKNVFSDHHNKSSFQNQIVSKISNFIDSMVLQSKVSNMQNIIDKIRNILTQYQKEDGLKGLIQINEIAGKLVDFLDQVQLFEKMNDDTFFSSQFKNKVDQYKKEAMINKGKVIEIQMNILESVLEGYLENFFKKNTLINIAVKSNEFHFSQLQSVLKSVAHNLQRSKVKEAEVLKKLHKQTSTLFTNLKKERKNLVVLSNTLKQQNKSIENYQIQQLIEVQTHAKAYKQQLFIIIFQFETVNNKISKKGKSQIKQNSLDQDQQFIYLKQLIEDISSLKTQKSAFLPCFQAPSNLSFLDKSQAKDIQSQISQGIVYLQPVQLRMERIQKNNIQFQNIFGNFYFDSDILNNINTLLQISNVKFSSQRIKQAPKQFTALLNKLSFKQYQPQSQSDKKLICNFIAKLLYIRLYPLIKGDDIAHYQLQGENKEKINEGKINQLRQLLRSIQWFLSMFSFPNMNKTIKALQQAKQKLQDVQGYQFDNNRIHTNAECFQNVSNIFYNVSLNKTQKQERIKSFIQILKNDKTQLETMINNSLQNNKDKIKSTLETLKQVQKNIVNLLEFGKGNKVEEGVKQYSKFMNNGDKFLTEIQKSFCAVRTGGKEVLYLCKLEKKQFMFNEIVPKFLMAIKLQTTNKQLMSKLENQWKIQFQQTKWMKSPESTKYKTQNMNNLQKNVFLSENQIQDDIPEQQFQNPDGEVEGFSSQTLKTPVKQTFNQQNTLNKQSINIQFDFIPSISKLFSSIISLQQFKQNYQQKVQKQKSIIMQNINQIHTLKFNSSSSSSNNNIQKLLNDSKNIITNIESYIQTFLSQNIFKQFLQNELPLINITPLLKTLFSKLDISLDNLMAQDLSQIQEMISKSVSKSFILTRNNLIIYQSLNESSLKQYIQSILKKIKTSFTAQQINTIVEVYIQKTNQRQYQCKQNFQELDVGKNNQTLKELVKQIIASYEFKQLKAIFQTMIQCKINRSEENISEFRRQVEEFISKIKEQNNENYQKNAIDELVIRYSGQIQEKVKQAKQKIDNQDKKLEDVLVIKETNKIGQNVETVLDDVYIITMFSKNAQKQKHQILEMIRKKMQDWEKSKGPTQQELAQLQRKRKQQQDQRQRLRRQKQEQQRKRQKEQAQKQKTKQEQIQRQRRQQLRLKIIQDCCQQIATEPADETNSLEISVILSEGVDQQVWRNIQNMTSNKH